MDNLTHKKNSYSKSFSLFYTIITSVIVASLVSGSTVWFFVSHFNDSNTTESSVEELEQEINSSLSNQVSTEMIPDIVERVSPAVVSVSITADVPIMEQYLEEYSPFGGLFGRDFGFSIPQRRQVGTEKREIGGGTGFFVSPDGFIVTNRHVVDNTGVDYSIITNSGDSYEVEVVAKDPTLDIAILKVDSDNDFPYLEFGDSDSVRLGSTVVAIGNALAEFPNSVSVGVVSGLARDIVAGNSFGSMESLEGVIQTDAAINQGNSGGPLLNIDGKVIGVNVAMAVSGQNIGFALPADSVKDVFSSVEEYGEIIRPFMGVRHLQINEMIAEQNNLPVDYGALIIRGETRTELAVMPGSAADKAGLEENDIILEIDGQPLDGSRSLARIIRDYQVGDTVMLLVLKDGEKTEIDLTLEKAPSN